MRSKVIFANVVNVCIYYYMLNCLVEKTIADDNIDCSYCKKYTAAKDVPNVQTENSGGPFLFMGDTYSKRFYMTNTVTTADFFTAAYSTCARYGLQLATIRTTCEYCILKTWFFNNFPTTYSAWIAGFRSTNDQTPYWITTREPLNFAQFGLNDTCIPGPYPTESYSPLAYPWVNCLSVSRNCPYFPYDPTKPCLQTVESPDLQFMWKDCRLTTLRTVCEEISYS